MPRYRSTGEELLLEGRRTDYLQKLALELKNERYQRFCFDQDHCMIFFGRHEFVCIVFGWPKAISGHI